MLWSLDVDDNHRDDNGYHHQHGHRGQAHQPPFYERRARGTTDDVYTQRGGGSVSVKGYSALRIWRKAATEEEGKERQTSAEVNLGDGDRGSNRERSGLEHRNKKTC